MKMTLHTTHHHKELFNQQYLNCYRPNFDDTLKVSSWEHLEQIPTVTGTFVQATITSNLTEIGAAQPQLVSNFIIKLKQGNFPCLIIFILYPVLCKIQRCTVNAHTECSSLSANRQHIFFWHRNTTSIEFEDNSFMYAKHFRIIRFRKYK